MTTTARVDGPTVIGWGLLLLPALTMWHEIGGHALTCAAAGGSVTAIGAFYIHCAMLSGMADVAVALAGVVANLALAVVAHWRWRLARTDSGRLALWLIWVSQGFVAAGYLIFSGATGGGDLGTGAAGGLRNVTIPGLRLAELISGIICYGLVLRAAKTTLATMLGADAGSARRTIAWSYYGAAGLAAVLTGLVNPVGLAVTLGSAVASSVGGLAGFISIGASGESGTGTPGLRVTRSRAVIIAGLTVAIGFVLVLGPTLVL